MGIEISTDDGILVNTWQELESETLGALKHKKYLSLGTKVPVYPVGPLIRPQWKQGFIIKYWAG